VVSRVLVRDGDGQEREHGKAFPVRRVYLPRAFDRLARVRLVAAQASALSVGPKRG